MRHPLAAARPARLRRLQSGGGRALLAWLARWRGEAERFGRWRRVGGALHWIARPPRLAAVDGWDRSLSAVLERPAPASAAAPRRSRRAAAPPGEASRGGRAALSSARDRRLPLPAEGPARAGRALLGRLAGPSAAGSRTPEAERLPLSRQRASPRRQSAPTTAKADDLAAWRARLLDRSLARERAAGAPAIDTAWRPEAPAGAIAMPRPRDGASPRTAAGPLPRAEAAAAWASRLEGAAVTTALLRELAAPRGATARAAATPTSAGPTSSRQVGGMDPVPARPGRTAEASPSGPVAPGDAAARVGTPPPTAAGPQPRPPHFALSGSADLSGCDGLFHALEAAPAVREDPFLRLAETEHLPPAPLGPFALPEERAPPHALPREAAPEQRPGNGSRPSQETAERAAAPDLATLAEALDRILRDEARRHGVDV